VLAALVAVREGALTLDEPIATYWKEYGVRGKEPTTLRQVQARTVRYAACWDRSCTPNGHDQGVAAPRTAPCGIGPPCVQPDDLAAVAPDRQARPRLQSVVHQSLEDLTYGVVAVRDETFDVLCRSGEGGADGGGAGGGR
jgi:hypothetical protein